MAEIPDWLAARRAPAPDSDSIEWDALRTAQELFDRNRDGLMTGEAFNANVTPAIELVQIVRDATIDGCAVVVKEMGEQGAEVSEILDAVLALKEHLNEK